MLRRSLLSAPFALAFAALVWASPAAADHHGWRGHGHHHHHGCDHGGYYYAPRYVEHHYTEYREYPVYYYEPRPVYHPIVVFGLPSVVFRASVGGGVDWDDHDD